MIGAFKCSLRERRHSRLPRNVTRQPAISLPMGRRADGLPNSVQIAAAQFRDDLVLRAARAIELAQPFEVADLG